MKTVFNVYFTLTEVTRQQIPVLAETLREAIEAVETYAFDTDDAWEIDSSKREVSDVTGE